MVTKTIYKTKDYSKVKFSFSQENASTVKVMGLNNDWKKGFALTKKKDGTFAGEINLDKGTRHEFKYLVNKTEWVDEPTADEQQPNTFGTVNSVITL